MNVIAATVAAALLAALPLSSQASSVVQLTASQEIAGAMDFEVPSLKLKGTVRPVAEKRLYVVSLSLGEQPMEADVRRFRLVTSGGTLEPIGAGASAILIIPLDKIPLDREVGQILPSNAIVSLTRSAAGVTIEAEPHGTIAFLYEVPLTAAVRSLTLPDGRAIRIVP